MFSLTVRDQIMIAHSFRGAIFGPAQKLHGATFVVEMTLRRPDMDQDDLVADIGRAGELLAEVLAPLNYQNLDELEAFEGRNTTTEFLAHAIWTRLAARIAEDALGTGTGRSFSALAVTLKESPDAWASFENALPA